MCDLNLLVTFCKLYSRNRGRQAVILCTLQIIPAKKLKCPTSKALNPMKSDGWGQFTELKGLEHIFYNVNCYSTQILMTSV